MGDILKKCPFCAGIPKMEETVCDLLIRCEECKATISADNNLTYKNELIDLWNNRQEAA